MMIVDGQVHIWKAETPDRPWTKGLEPQLPEPLGIEDLMGHMESAGVGRVIIVPPHWEGLRNDYATEAYDRFPDKFRFMGRLNLERPDARAQLPAWMKQRGCLGMRQSFLSTEEREKITSGGYDWLFEDAERYDIPLMMHASGMPEVVEGIAALARFPNVSTKVSSAPLHSGEAYPFRNMHGYIKRIIDAFGVKRCYWATDLSHMLHTCSYRDGVTMFTEELGLSQSDLEWVMGRSICEALNWPI